MPTHFPPFLSFSEFVEGLKNLDNLMAYEDVQLQYLEPPVGDAVPELKFEAHYRSIDNPAVAVDIALTTILLTADVLLLDKQGCISATVKSQLESVGYSVTMNTGNPASKWSLAKITGKNFSFNFG